MPTDLSVCEADMPRVSVLIPVYNCERYLQQALESILRQTMADFEVLVLDDGSSDRSVEIAKAIAVRDQRVIVAEGGHCGVVAQRNRGIALARADLVAMMDADDIASPDRLAVEVAFLEKHPEVCAVGAQVLRIDSDGLPIDFWKLPERHEDIDEAHIEGRPGAIVNPTVMMRRDVVQQIGGYRANYDSAEDYDLFLRLGEVGRLANVRGVLLRYRLHLKSLTFSRAEYQREMARKALEEAWLRRKRAGTVPTGVLKIRTPSEEELMWDWARSAFAARNFHTARNHSLRLLRRRPMQWRRWVLFGAAALGPLGWKLRQLFSFRIGDYKSSD